MRDSECVTFLQWALPRMGYRWPGFRKVRRQVCKRIQRRIQELDLADLEAYRRHLASDPQEWSELDACCGITISRFGRDREVFRRLTMEVLPALASQRLAAGIREINVWSAGCGSGEEPYSLAILAESAGLSGVPLLITATDSNSHQLQRARAAIYPGSSLRELSPAVCRRAFDRIEDDTYRLRDPYRSAVTFSMQDIRRALPAGPFDLILLRNLAFTYFDGPLQRRILNKVTARLARGGYLVIGSHEQLPETLPVLVPLSGCRCILGPPDAPDAADTSCDNRD